MSVGQIVFSKQGRDKGLPFVVMSTKENYLYLADGKLRKIENPKKKKVMHVAKTNYIDTTLAFGIVNNEHIKNSDIRKAIENFIGKGV
ncbi:MAG: KOW domain-containing RNA-binding protein [Defluviitaleaceae bacterium]|nr:KOW domain-containing RNA-binding protein [Defluviitaleaceae bacterium]